MGRKESNLGICCCQNRVCFPGGGVEYLGYQLAHSDSQYFVPLVPPVKEVFLYASVFRCVHKVVVSLLVTYLWRQFGKTCHFVWLILFWKNKIFWYFVCDAQWVPPTLEGVWGLAMFQKVVQVVFRKLTKIITIFSGPGP